MIGHSFGIDMDLRCVLLSAPSTDRCRVPGTGVPNQNTSRIQYKEVYILEFYKQIYLFQLFQPHFIP